LRNKNSASGGNLDSSGIKIMKNWRNFNTDKLPTTGLDSDFGFAIIIIVKPTAFSIYRDSGFYL
jgi:hypothetical protein